MQLLRVIGLALGTVTAFVGWGRAVEGFLGRRAGGDHLPRLSIGVAASLGLAVSLISAGFVVAVDQYKPLIGWMWLLIGCVLSTRGITAWAFNKKGRLRMALLVATVGVLGVQVFYLAVGALGDAPWNPCDDHVAYVPLADRLRETGGMIEPFSQRRVVGLGGATVLHSFFIAALGTDAVFAADIVVGGLVAGLLLLPFVVELPRFIMGSVLVASFTLWESMQANLSPTYLVIPLIAGALLLVSETHSRSLLDSRLLMLLALFGGGLLTLRVAFAVPIALFGLALVVRANEANVSNRLRAAAVLGFGIGVPMVPWMFALWRSSGTPLYPPFGGNLDTSWPGFRASDVDLWTKFVDVVMVGQIRWMLLALILAALALLIRRKSGIWAEIPMLALPGVVITAVAVLIFLSAFRSSDLARYVWPFLAGTLVAALVLLANEAASHYRHLRGAVPALLVVATACVLATPVDRVKKQLEGRLAAVATIWSGYHSDEEPWDSVRDDYARIQARLPAGAQVATASDYPHLFNLQRNEVFGLDVLGSASPPPGMPLGKRFVETTQYLRDQGFAFIVVTDPAQSACLYNRQVWQSHLTRGARPFAQWAPYFLDWFGWIDARVTEVPRLVSYQGSLIAIDLRGRM